MAVKVLVNNLCSAELRIYRVWLLKPGSKTVTGSLATEIFWSLWGWKAQKAGLFQSKGKWSR